MKNIQAQLPWSKQTMLWFFSSNSQGYVLPEKWMRDDVFYGVDVSRNGKETWQPQVITNKTLRTFLPVWFAPISNVVLHLQDIKDGGKRMRAPYSCLSIDSSQITWHIHPSLFNIYYVSKLLI